jgi:hypothetical protein
MNKKFGGWIIKDKLHAQIKIANELWWTTLERPFRQYHLVFIGWYEQGEFGKLFTFNVLFVSIQVGLGLKNKKRK